MAQELSSTFGEAPPRPRRRGRRIAYLTLLMAGAYLCATDIAVNGGDRFSVNWDGIRQVNSARAIMIALVPTPTSAPHPTECIPQTGGFLPFLGPAPLPAPDSEQKKAYQRQLREVAAVEGAAYVWQRVMWGLSGFLVAVAILSWITPWGRGWHLLAGLAIVVVAFFSLACLRYLELPDGLGASLWPLKPEWHSALAQRWGIPEGGGLPPLSPQKYLSLAAYLSAYGWLLILVVLLPSARPSVAKSDTSSTQM